MMVVIYGLKPQLEQIKKPLANIVQRCLVFALGLPTTQLSQRFVGLDSGDIILADRSAQDYLQIEVNLMQGHLPEAKKLLIRMLFDEMNKQLGLLPHEIDILIKEQPTHCWGLRGMSGDDIHFAYNIDS
ncbi:tautomerase family protein [Pasteurellaceae bacterium HPA106]|uniref:tautomerase family protein n=1 Tax=Spirabiliibacterium pneumoniae TaxID=221400 RepID=UPI001AADE8CD|nr:tautomerase family protein [Spirabiliibacterium pneumoniae]MBE2896616.1 tautomerase family protein [Spirabiliibacterium pneumoniae]